MAPSYASVHAHDDGLSTGRGMAFAALALGLFSLVAWIFFGLSAATGLGAIIFGTMARRKAFATGAGTGMATTGIVLGALGILLALLYWFIWADIIAEMLACRATPNAPGCA